MKLIRISRRIVTAAVNKFMNTAPCLNSLRVFPELRRNMCTNMHASPVLHVPCIHDYLDGFVTKHREKCVSKESESGISGNHGDLEDVQDYE